MTKFKDGYKLNEDNQPMSYTHVHDTSLFVVNSLRSKGATAAIKSDVNEVFNMFNLM